MLSLKCATNGTTSSSLAPLSCNHPTCLPSWVFACVKTRPTNDSIDCLSFFVPPHHIHLLPVGCFLPSTLITMSTNDSGYNRHDNISVNGVFAINGDGNRATEELLVDNVMLNGDSDSAATKEELLQGFLSLMTMVMKRISMEDGGRVGHGIF